MISRRAAASPNRPWRKLVERPIFGALAAPRSDWNLARPGALRFIGARMPLPYKVATLLYCFNERDEVLLLERAQEPNRGFWSPCGGKVHLDDGESPYACACREAFEELGVRLTAGDLHLTGVVSEHAYAGAGHWLMFLFEVKPRLRECPPQHREGTFRFFAPHKIPSLNIPQTDRDIIWPLFWKHRGGFFAAHWKWFPDGRTEWTTEESRPKDV